MIRQISISKILKLPIKLVWEIIKYFISSNNGVVLFYNDHRKKVIKLIKKIKSETDMLLLDNEAYQIFMAIENTKKIEGDIAEVGVYKGGSAKLICENKGNKKLYLFDSFEGLPNPSDRDTDGFCKGSFKYDFNMVKNYLKGYENVYLYKGFFPKTSKPIKDKMFSFVHLDVDLYDSTLECLKFFYPRMSKGGIIISHDYMWIKGVRKAFDSFFKDKSEPIIEMSGSQCLIVKTENEEKVNENTTKELQGHLKNKENIKMIRKTSGKMNAHFNQYMQRRINL